MNQTGISSYTEPQLAELVCSNSLRSDELASGVGLIKQELRELGSALMAVADATRVPAGKALAVDRELFAGKDGACGSRAEYHACPQGHRRS